MVDTKENEENLFRIVGANYKAYEVSNAEVFVKRKKLPIASIVVLSIIVFCCIFAPLITNKNPTMFYLKNLNESPNKEFYFGTDTLGRDLFSIIFFGGRISLIVGVLSAFISSVIGIIYGSISGTANKVVDSIMMRIAELFGSVPSILLILILTSIAPASNYIYISFVIGITSWFSLARIVRSEVRQIRNTEYVIYARCTGDGFFGVLRKHLLPNFMSAILFVVVSSVGTSMITESTLSFLGLGLPVEILSWGSMLSLANKAIITNTWWVVVIPGIFLVVTLVCITNIGSFLRKANNRKPNIL